jgi:hypothetical protein
MCSKSASGSEKELHTAATEESRKTILIEMDGNSEKQLMAKTVD